MTKPVVIFEPSASGHQFYHARLILEAAHAAGLSTVFATTEDALADSSASPLQRMLDAGLPVMITRPKPEFKVAGRIHPVLQQQFVQTKALGTALKVAGGRRAFCHVFVPFFDAYMTTPLALRLNPCLGIPMSGILHRTRFHMPSMGIRTTLPFHVRVERFVYASLLRRKDVRQLFTMDPYLDRFFGDKRVSFLKDPGMHAPRHSRDETRAALGIASGQLCILVHGALDSRKAIGTLLDAVAALPEPGRVVVILAGRQDEHVSTVMALPKTRKLLVDGRVIEIKGFLDDETVYDLLGACDVCWVCYLNSDGNSGIMMKAGQARRPVITANTGIGARLVIDDHIGWQADPASSANVLATIQQILNDSDALEAAGHAIFERFKSHTVDNFVDPIITHLRAASVSAAQPS